MSDQLDERARRAELFNQTLRESENTHMWNYDDFKPQNTEGAENSDYIDTVEDPNLLTNLKNRTVELNDKYNDIKEKYNSIPSYRAIGGYKGLLDANKYKASNTADMVKEIIADKGIDKKFAGSLEKRINSYADEYKVPTYLAGLAVAASIEHNRGNFSKQALYPDFELGEQTSIDSDVETILDQFTKDPKAFAGLKSDMENVKTLDTAVDNLNGIYSNAYGNIENNQNQYNKLRYLSDDNGFKYLAHQSLQDRNARSIDQLDKAFKNYKASFDTVNKTFNKNHGDFIASQEDNSRNNVDNKVYSKEEKQNLMQNFVSNMSIPGAGTFGLSPGMQAKIADDIFGSAVKPPMAPVIPEEFTKDYNTDANGDVYTSYGQKLDPNNPRTKRIKRVLDINEKMTSSPRSKEDLDSIAKNIAESSSLLNLTRNPVNNSNANTKDLVNYLLKSVN